MKGKCLFFDSFYRCMESRVAIVVFGNINVNDLYAIVCRYLFCFWKLKIILELKSVLKL